MSGRHMQYVTLENQVYLILYATTHFFQNWYLYEVPNLYIAHAVIPFETIVWTLFFE